MGRIWEYVLCTGSVADEELRGAPRETVAALDSGRCSGSAVSEELRDAPSDTREVLGEELWDAPRETRAAFGVGRHPDRKSTRLNSSHPV